MRDAKSASRRQEDDTDRLRDEMKSLKDGIPKSLSANKDFTDGRLREIANEVKSLKALMGQRMSTSSPAPAASTNTGNYLKPTSGNAAPATPAATPATPAADVGAKENGDAKAAINGDAAPETGKKDYLSSLGGRSSPFGSGLPAAKASIPAWQMAMANKSSGSDAANGAQQEAGSSS
jgi:peroxin-14